MNSRKDLGLDKGEGSTAQAHTKFIIRPQFEPERRSGFARELFRLQREKAGIEP